MCGIIGILGEQPAAPLLIDGLKRLEYRGYDSAGIATLEDGQIERCRAEGKLVNLEEKIGELKTTLSGTSGIGHTRWATHGAPVEDNAHPHANEHVAIVHNGIIENFREIKQRLEEKGHIFKSQTDSEVICHLISDYLQDGATPKEAVLKSLNELHGAFALAILFAGEEDLMIGARRGSPLAVGYGKGEMYLGSDALALAPLTQRLCYLEEGDCAVLSKTSVEIYDADGKAVERPIQQTELSGALIGKGNYRHFMLKEIHEQPAVMGDTLTPLIDPISREVVLRDFNFDLSKIKRLMIVACGTSYYAGMTAQYWLESLTGLPTDCQIASEFRYRQPVLDDTCLTICISQSGETADTLAALRHAKALGSRVTSVLNVPNSSMGRESDAVFLTKAGPEIGVASTKAFTTQLVVLACLAVGLGQARGVEAASPELVRTLTEVPEKITSILAQEKRFEELGRLLAEHRYVLYLGRGTQYPIALEGALKLKEISYIHAEGYAAGEMKHGPIALIEEDVPVIVLAPSQHFGDSDEVSLFEKTVSNCQEVHARGGKLLVVSDANGLSKLNDITWQSVEIPAVEGFEAPLLYSVPVQLLAYHAAVAKGTDVDQPRNLAKSVTVE